MSFKCGSGLNMEAIIINTYYFTEKTLYLAECTRINYDSRIIIILRKRRKYKFKLLRCV